MASPRSRSKVGAHSAIAFFTSLPSAKAGAAASSAGSAARPDSAALQSNRARPGN